MNLDKYNNIQKMLLCVSTEKTITSADDIMSQMCAKLCRKIQGNNMNRNNGKDVVIGGMGVDSVAICGKEGNDDAGRQLTINNVHKEVTDGRKVEYVDGDLDKCNVRK